MDWFSSPITAENNTELIRRLQVRDVEAAGEVYGRFGRLLFSLILNIVGDRQTAEDLLAEVLVKAFNQIQSFDSSQIDVGSWLLILGRNHALKFRGEMTGAADHNRNWNTLESPSLYAGRQATGTEFLGTGSTQRAYLNLAEQDRLILELAWFEAMTFDEIALRLDRTVADVGAAAAAALARLREA